jgi:oligopeptidase B
MLDATIPLTTAEYEPGDQLALSQYYMNAGHGGASGRFERYKLYALEHAFFLRLAGIKE